MKNGDETAAIITVDGAWIDVVQRKLTIPPDKVTHVFEKMPKAELFIWDK
jgi:acyl-CoA thioester hydrolase